MTERIERIAIVVLILWVVSFIPNPLTTIVVARMYGHDEFQQFQFLKSVLASISILLTWGVHIAIGVWLFFEAKRNQKSKWSWLLFGIVFGLVAVVLFVLLQIHADLRTRKEKGTTNTGL